MKTADRRRWAKLVEEQPRSGLTMVKFAHRSGVSVSSMHRWRRLLAGVPAASPVFVAIKTESPACAVSSRTITIKVGSTISLEVPPELIGGVVRDLVAGTELWSR